MSDLKESRKKKIYSMAFLGSGANDRTAALMIDDRIDVTLRMLSDTENYLLMRALLY